MNYVRANPFFTIIDLSSPSVSAFATIARGARAERTCVPVFFFPLLVATARQSQIRACKKKRGAAFRGLKPFAVNQLHEVNRGGN